MHDKNTIIRGALRQLLVDRNGSPDDTAEDAIVAVLVLSERTSAPEALRALSIARRRMEGDAHSVQLVDETAKTIRATME